MKQVLQSLKTGETSLVEVPAPQAQSGSLLIKSSRSLVSPGTERTLRDFGKAGWIQKARQQPDKVAMVIDKVKTDGLVPTIEAVQAKLDSPMALGYCNVGRVIAAPGTSFEPGSRVVSNGHHAEIVRVPKNLCALIPDGVDDDSAAFTVIAAIALQGVRLLKPTLGEAVAVIGLGLVGLLSVQILRASGCRVLGIDFDARKCQLAQQFGAETIVLSKGADPLPYAINFSNGRGMDAVIIAASSQSNDPVSQAAAMCRKRGRIVLVGVVGLNLSRADFYEKELTFQVSCSYGPGRYDVDYEEKGLDYPIGYVRWTEQRNFEAVLELMREGSIDVKPLITLRYDISDAVDAYEALSNSATLGLMLDYPNSDDERVEQDPVKFDGVSMSGRAAVTLGVIGAGNYASRVLIPSFKSAGARLETVATSRGISGVQASKNYGFRFATTDLAKIYSDKNINTVVVATQHHLHAEQICGALDAGKHVFVEKPLALAMGEIEEIAYAFEAQKGRCKLMVGYNRRFSPQVKKMKSLLESVNSPKVFLMTMSPGEIPKGHWTQDVELGGGRIIGEACHYIDLMRFLADSPIKSFDARSVGAMTGNDVVDDKATITISFEDGSLGTIHYLANGGTVFPKERIEIFANNSVLQLDNFRTLRGFGWKGFNKMSLWRQDKGQRDCIKAFVGAIERDEDCPIPIGETLEVATATIKIAESLRS
jgi:predicted dehydrogenase/threonine dehydrogenase-like Zn-dependent dehydrogenase